MATSNNYTTKLDFDKDFIENIVSELARNNINVDINEDPEKIKIRFFNFKKRLIPAIKRHVLKSDIFTCATELEEGLKLLEHKIINGENLTPNLSRQLTNLDYNDSLLNDWGIYHLHLGTEIETDGFIKRTGPVLFARFDNTNAYLINVMPHGSWTDQKMIKVLHDNWEESIELFRFKGIAGLAHVSTDDDIKLARKFGVNISIEIAPGVVYTSIGGGYTTAKTSIDVMMAMIRYNEIVKHLQEYVRENIDKIGAELKDNYNYKGKELHLKLLIEEGEYFAVEQNTMVAFNLGKY